MAATGEEARRRRAEARERRRSAMTKPFEELDRDAGPKRESSEPGEPAKTLKHAAATAAVGAIAAGLAGAGKAWLERRAADGDAQPEVDRGPAETGDGSDLAGEEEAVGEGSTPSNTTEIQAAGAEPAQTEDGGGGDDEASPGTDQEGVPASAQTDEEPAASDDQAPPGDDTDDDDTDDDDRDDDDTVRAEVDQAPREQRAVEDDRRRDGDRGVDEAEEDARPRGAAAGEASELVEAARGQLERLFGAEVESVTGLERSNEHWSVTLEVVELHRVPESTDVLAAYEVVLDDDGKLVRVDRKRRYRRSEVGEQ